jgi:hypothetical protein
MELITFPLGMQKQPNQEENLIILVTKMGLSYFSFSFLSLFIEIFGDLYYS